MFDLIIMLSRYLFIFYIVLFLWQGIVYVAYEQGGFLGNPYTAVSMQRRITVLMHMTAFLILGYNRETYMFDITTLLFGAVSLVFLLFAVKLLDRFYYEGCPLIWTGMLFLMDVSLIILQRVEPSLAHRQLMWMCIGLAGMSFLPTFFRWIPRFEMFEWVYIIGCYLLLLSTRFFGVSKYGSTNWLAIGPVTFQPSEIAKFLFVFYLASVFRKRVEWKQFLTTGILSAGLVMLLVLQKDLGSALIFFMTYMVMLYIATSNEFLFFLGMGAASVAAMGAYKLFSHVQVRVAAWRNPWADIDAGGYQIVSSLFAITTWGLFGSGLTKGMPKSIPVVESDMIFSAICEEFGVIFGAGIIGIFIMLLYCTGLQQKILQYSGGRGDYADFVSGVCDSGRRDEADSPDGGNTAVCQLRRQLGSGQPDDDWAFAVGMRILRAARSAGAGGAADDGGNADGRRQI